MTSTDDRIHAVTEFGFTERQARFLVLVMRHAGVCVPRQYARFAGVAYGAKCNAFFDKLVRRGCARVSDCVHNRARLYHVHSKSLYHVIGEGSSRYRRSGSPRLAIERLMLLDAVLTMPDLEWLTTAPEKAAYLATLKGSAGVATEHAVVSEPDSKPTAKLPAAFPIGVEAGGRTVLLYLATEAWTDAFRSFLQAHVALLNVAPTWTLRIVFPRPLDLVYDAYQRVVHEELESSLQPATIGELQWYFEHRDKAAREGVHPQIQAFVDVGHRVFGAPRFGDTTKDRENRRIPFDPEGRLAAILHRRGKLGPEAFVFGSENGEYIGSFKTAWESLLLVANGHYTKRVRPGAGLDRVKLRQIDLHWHDLRHEGACRLLNDSVDIRIIQLMLGHASVQQTQRYLNVTDEELRKGLEVSWKRRTLKAVAGGHNA